MRSWSWDLNPGPGGGSGREWRPTSLTGLCFLTASLEVPKNIPIVEGKEDVKFVQSPLSLVCHGISFQMQDPFSPLAPGIGGAILHPGNAAPLTLGEPGLAGHRQ